MCGILAIASHEHPSKPPEIGRAMSRLARRGPDGAGRWNSPSRSVTLAHTRLAIVDLSDAGRQPMLNEDSATAVVFNGEIYNAPKLTRALTRAGYRFRSRSDTEVLVHGYQHWGIHGLLDRLLGMFAFVIWDERESTLYAATDHAGQKPLYWSCANGAFFAASDADALRCILPQPPALDPTGLCHILCHGYCPPPHTVWQGIHKLAPAQALRFTPGDTSPQTWRHWSPPEELAGTSSDPAAQQQQFAALFEEVVADHTLADVPVSLFLSGGLDSSAVALAISRTGHPLEALTLALDSGDDESPAAAETARALGLPHSRIAFAESNLDDTLAAAADAFDEPQAYGAVLTATRIAQCASARSKVVIAGDGGDEAFAGYTWHRVAAALHASRLPQNAASASITSALSEAATDGATRALALQSLAGRSFLHAHLQSVFPRFHPAEAAALFAPLSPRYDEHTYAAWAGEHDRPDLPLPRRLQRLDLLGFCAGSILPKIDRSAMAVGLELRAPFLDRRILDWSLKQPVRPEELNAATSKPVLRDYLRGRTPEGVLSRRKQGFSLRLGRDVWTKRLPQLRRSRLVTSGTLNAQWESFVAPDAPYRSSRIFALCMIAAWAETRI